MESFGSDVLRLAFMHLWVTSDGINLSAVVWVVFLGCAGLDAAVANWLYNDLRINGRPIMYTVRRSISFNALSAVAMAVNSVFGGLGVPASARAIYAIAAFLVIGYFALRPLLRAVMAARAAA